LYHKHFFKRLSLVWIILFNLLFTSNLFAETQECPDGATEIGCSVGIHTIIHNFNIRKEYGKLDIEGNIAYIGSGDSIVSIDISIINKPIFLKFIINNFENFIFDIKVKNSLIYISHTGGLSIFDIKKSKIISTLEIEASQSNSQTIKVIDNYAYIQKDNKLYIVDILESKNPKLVNKISISSEFYIKGDSLFAGGDRYPLVRYDISDKTEIKKLSLSIEKANYFIIVGNYLYAYSASWEDKQYINIYDISNPNKFILKKTIKSHLPYVNFQNNKYLYTSFRGDSSGSTTMQTFSISDPLNPRLVSTHNKGFYSLHSFVVKNNYLIATDFDSSFLKIFDISNPQKGNIENIIHNISFFKKDINHIFSIGDNKDSGNASDIHNTLNIMNMSNIKNPSVVYSQYIPNLNSYRSDINKERLAFSGRWKDVTLYDLSNDSNFSKKSVITTSTSTSVKIKDNYLYLKYHETDNEGNALYKLDIIDISDLSKPKKINTIDIVDGTMKLVDNYIYIYGKYLRIIDISNPSKTYMIKESLKLNYIYNLAIQNNNIYTLMYSFTDGYKFLTIDKSNPKDLKIINDFKVPRTMNQMFKSLQIHQNYAFLLNEYEFIILNLNNSKKIKLELRTSLRNNGTKISYFEGDYIYISGEYNTYTINWKNLINSQNSIKSYYSTHDVPLTEESLSYKIEKLVIADADSNEYVLDKIPANKPLTIIADTNINAIDDINFKWSIDGTLIKEGFGTDNSYLDYTFTNSNTKISLSIQRGTEPIVTKEITAILDGEYIAYNIERIGIADADSNEFEADSVPTNKPLTLLAVTNVNTTDDINFKWVVDGETVKEALGKDGGDYLDYTFTKPSTTITLTINRGSEGEVTKELKVTTQLNSLEDLRAIGEGRKIVAIDSYFEEGIDRTGNYYRPTGKKLGIYDSKKDAIIANITLSDASKVKVYSNQIISTDDKAYITFTDDKLPLFRGKFKIEDGVLRNLLIAEAMNEEKLNRVIDVDKYCEDVTNYETLVDNSKKQKCKELIDNTKLDRALVSFISKNVPPVTDATLLAGIDANAIGLSPSLMATPFLWSGELNLEKKEFKLTALASAASTFNMKGNDYSLLTDIASVRSKTKLLSTAKSLGRIPFIYTLKSDGSAKTEVGKSKLNIKALTLEFSDSKSLVLETKVIKTSDNDKFRKNTATIKKAKAYLSFNQSSTTNIGFDINNAKLEEKNGKYELISYDGGANFSIPNIPLGKGRSIKNVSAGIYFVGRSSIYDTDDWPVAFTDTHSPTKSKFYVYLKGHGEYVKESAPNKVDPNDPLGSMNNSWTTGDDYKNTLTVDFKVIPFPVAHYDNGLLLSADLGYRTDGTSNILNLKGLKLKELEGKYRYDTNLDDFLWKASASIEAVKYRGRGSLYWNWGDNLALGATIKNFGLSITNNKRFILGEGCMLGGKLTPTFMSLAECPNLSSSCASKLDISKNALIANGYIFGMKAQPHYESRFSAAYPWENPFPYLEANAELGFKVLMDEKVKKGNANAIQFSDPKLTANLAGSGSLSMKIPKSKSTVFPFPTKDINLLELCVGMSPFDVKHYYDEGLFVTTEKVENVKGLFGFYGKASITGKEAVVFYSFFPFKIKDVEEEQTWLYGTNFKIEVKDTVSKNKQDGQYRKISKVSNTPFNMNKTIEGDKVVETLVIPENNSGPLVLIKGVTDVEITTASGEIVNAGNADNFESVTIEKSTDSVTIGLNNPNSGTWKFKFKNTDYEFLVYSENKAPTVSASTSITSVEYGSNFSVNLDFKDADSPRGYVKIVAIGKQGEEYVLFDNNISVPYNDSIALTIPKIGEFELKLFATDGLRAYKESSLGTITITEPSKFIDDLEVTSSKSSLTSEWKSLNIVEGFDVTLTNKTSSTTNVYDKNLPNFSQENLQNGVYTLKIEAKYKGKIVDTLTKEFTVDAQKTCSALEGLEITEEFDNGYLLNFETTDASYYLVDIQSYTDKFKHIEKRQIKGKIDISSLVGEGVYVTIEAFNSCGESISKSKELMVSNKIDTDNDSLYDDWEEKYFGNLNQSTDDDFDSDGVTNLDEQTKYILPTNGDTDSDKVSDKDDPNPYLNMDSNQNRVSDDWELFYNVGDLSEDYDGDGISSYDEYFLGTNPKVKDNNLNNTTDNKAPVIKTDKDDFKTLTVALSDSLNINASSSFDTDGDTITYSWVANGKEISDFDTVNLTYKTLGKHYLKLILSDGNNHTTSKTWTVFVTKQTYDFSYIETGKEDVEIYHSGVKFKFPKNLGIGKLFTADIPLKDLPNKPTNYTFLSENGKIFIFNGTNKLTQNMHIDHVSNDKLLRYSYEENKWYIVANEGKSRDTKFIGLFALATKNTVTPTTTSSEDSSEGGCFIATAAYGSYLQKDVQLLRNFRDTYLLTNVLGKEFVNVYYEYSPPIASYIANHEYLRTFTRWILTIIISIFKYPLLSILLFSLFLFRKKLLMQRI